MSRKLSSRASSDMFVTPRSGSHDEVEISNAEQFSFHYGPRMQMEAPEYASQQPQQDAQQQEQWVDQRRWEQEQQMQQQLQQPLNQQWQEQGQSNQQLFPPPEHPQNVEVLTAAVIEQLQQQQIQPEDLSKMVGEGEWQKPAGKAPSWKYSRALSSYTGFSSKREEETGKPEVQTLTSGIQMQNSGIYVEGVHQWNAVTNTPVEPLTQEARALESRKFTFDQRSGDYVNAYDPTDRIPAAKMEELQSALFKASVEETVVDVMRRRSTFRKMTMVSRLFLNMEKKDLSAISGGPGLPHVQLTYLPDRYIKTYDRTNCMGLLVSAREHTLTCL